MFFPELPDLEVTVAEEFCSEAIDLILDNENIKRDDDGRIRFYDLLAIALQSDKYSKQFQITALKEFAKYIDLHSEDDYDEILIPVKLEASPKYRKKLLKPGNFVKRKVKETDSHEEYFTKIIRWSSPEQVQYWLAQVLEYEVDPRDPSWYFSLEASAFLLHLIAANPKMKDIDHEAILSNLKKGTKGSSGGGYSKLKELEQKVLNMQQKIEDLQKELAEAKQQHSDVCTEYEETLVTHHNECSAWARLLNFLTLANLKLQGTINTQKETIAEQTAKLSFFTERDELVMENAPSLKEFWDLVVDLFASELDSPSIRSYTVREFAINNSISSHKDCVNKVHVLNKDVPGLMPFDEADIRTIAKPMGTLFRCLLDREPLDSNGKKYPESYSKLCQWLVYKCSRYNPSQWHPSKTKHTVNQSNSELIRKAFEKQANLQIA